jgi:lipoprotein NlpI
MSRLLASCLISLILSAPGAMAAGYDDFASGLSAVNRGDNDQAIANFTAALAAGDLHANLIPVAYLERARAYAAKSQCPAAREDTMAALKLKSDYEDALMLQAGLDECVADHKAAVDDLTRAIALRALPARYFARGRAHWNAGEFDACAADYRSGLTAATDKPPYRVLWAELCELRAGKLDPAAAEKDVSDIDDWPRTIFDLFQGKASPAEVDTAAAKGDASALPGQSCEASFYKAEWQLARKNEDEARRLLSGAQKICPRNFVEFGAAKIELDRLK